MISIIVAVIDAVAQALSLVRPDDKKLDRIGRALGVSFQ